MKANEASLPLGNAIDNNQADEQDFLWSLIKKMRFRYE